MVAEEAAAAGVAEVAVVEVVVAASWAWITSKLTTVSALCFGVGVGQGCEASCCPAGILRFSDA